MTTLWYLYYYYCHNHYYIIIVIIIIIIINIILCSETEYEICYCIYSHTSVICSYITSV